ncbi:MAG: hypothetical protein GX774_00820 [Armatimonadetes bacterium]|nr:hypothetical protein [Armatimonadota bacterium]
MPFQYRLRLTIQPGFHEAEKVDALVRFCRDAGIDDVMFFTSCGELDQGHATAAEMRPWLETIRRAGEALREIGTTTSLNPLMTLRHFDHGRVLKPGQRFERMVDCRGRQSSLTPCPLCPEFGRYLEEMFALYAEARPTYLWVEDDFRLHNHHPLEWGGCFCDRHLAEFSRRAGRPVSREEFVRAILAPGTPHPFRALWLDVCRESMVALAQRIGDAVRAVAPDTRLGLMSSDPAVHCAEARDWHGILRALAGPEHAPVLRPSLPAYREPSPAAYLVGFNQVSRQTRALVPANTECYPELENYPHARFTKSKRFSRFQITSALSLGIQGITMNLFDMMGNGIHPGQGWEAMLAETRPFCEAICALGLETMRPGGITVPVCPTAAYTLHTQQGERLEELHPTEAIWPAVLSAFGIANTYHATAPDALVDGCVALSGQYLRNLTTAQIERLFARNFVILDGDAVATLVALGLGELAGITRATWVALNEGRHSYEQVCDGERYEGLPEARLSLQETGCWFLDIEYGRPPALKPTTRHPSGEVGAPGIAVVDGRVALFPYGRYGAGVSFYFQPARQAILQAVLRGLGPDRCPPLRDRRGVRLPGSLPRA